MEPMPCSLTNILKGEDASNNTSLNGIPNHLRGLVFEYQRALQNLQLTILDCVGDEDGSRQIGKDFEELEKCVKKMIQKMA